MKNTFGRMSKAWLKMACAFFAPVLSMTAVAVAPAEDWLFIDQPAETISFGLREDVGAAHGDALAGIVSSGSDLSYVKAAGLPVGIRLDAKTHVLSGAPTKPGVYFVTLSAKNANGYEHSRIVKVLVRDANDASPAMPVPSDAAGLFEFADEDEYIAGWGGGAMRAGLPTMDGGACCVGLPASPATGAPAKSAKVSGLPAGLAYAVEDLLGADGQGGGAATGKVVRIYGIPSKPGLFTVTFNVTYEDRTALKSVRQYLVEDAGSRYASLMLDEQCAGMGTVSGTGVYRLDSPVKFTASPKAGCAFAGWYGMNESYDSTGGTNAVVRIAAQRYNAKGQYVDYRTASGSFFVSGMAEGGTALYARFVAKQDDVARIEDAGMDSPEGKSYEAQYGKPLELGMLVVSPSLPKVVAKGLPKGIVLSAAGDGSDPYRYVISAGKDAMPGIYNVTLTATTASKNATSASFAIKVLADDAAISVGDDLGEYDPGVAIAPPIDLSSAVDFGSVSSFAVSGLPKGLTWNPKANAAKGIGAHTISGTPTVPGEYLVVFSAKIPAPDAGSGKASGVVAYRTAGMRVRRYPELAVSVDDGADGGAGGCEVKGGGNYPATTKVSLKAIPAKGYVFAGWGDVMRDTVGETVMARLNPARTYMTGAADVDIPAKFVRIADDSLWIAEMEDFSVQSGVAIEGGELQSRIAEAIDTRSLPDISVSGLPPGLKWNAKTLSLSGKATKKGVYYATVSGRNASGYRHSRVVRFVVDGAVDADETNGAGLDEEVLNSFAASLRTGGHAGFEMPVPDSGNGAKPTKVTVKGLPAGLAGVFGDGMLRVFQNGVIAKPGRYAMTIEVAYSGDANAKTVRTLTVLDSGSRFVDVVVEDGSVGLGTVSGSGVYYYGEKLGLRATAAKGQVFAGWFVGNGTDGGAGQEPGTALFESALLEDAKMAAVDYRTPSPQAVFSCSVLDAASAPGETTTLHASFIAVTNDFVALATADGDLDGRTWNLDETPELHVTAESLSLPGTIAIKGLPTGIKHEQSVGSSVLLVPDASKTKPGVYTVTATVSNASKLKSSASFTVIVPNYRCDALSYLENAVDAYPALTVGVDATDNYLSQVDLSLDVGFEGYSINASGLPPGVSLRKTIEDGEASYALVGTPTKIGTYTVVFTAKKGADSQVASITLTVVPMADWAIGTFNGIGVVSSDDAETVGKVTLTTTQTGKCSGKLTTALGSSTLTGVLMEAYEDMYVYHGAIKIDGRNNDFYMTVYMPDVDTSSPAMCEIEPLYIYGSDVSFEAVAYRESWSQLHMPCFVEDFAVMQIPTDRGELSVSFRKTDVLAKTEPLLKAIYFDNEIFSYYETTSQLIVKSIEVEEILDEETGVSRSAYRVEAFAPVLFKLKIDGKDENYAIIVNFSISNADAATSLDVECDLTYGID